MFEILNKYQVSLFLKASEIVPSPDVISPLLNMFRDKGFLPTTDWPQKSSATRTLATK